MLAHGKEQSYAGRGHPECVATLTQVVSIAVGGMSRTAELCGMVSLSWQTRVG